MTTQPNVDDFLIKCGRATCVVGLPEEVVAMLFAMYSRNPRDLRATMQHMVDSGDLELPPAPSIDMPKKVQRFHERNTIGYGHKSVADHAQLHWVLEGVSTIVERNFLEARLLAASSVSTRFVNFREQGFVVPGQWPATSVDAFNEHCEALLDGYERLVPMAEEAIREYYPFHVDDWKSTDGWKHATGKRALDMVRDVLPAAMRTSFGVTNSATALREMLDKREFSPLTPIEVRNCASDVREVCRIAAPTLLPVDGRLILPHTPAEGPAIFGGSVYDQRSRVISMHSPDWDVVEEMAGLPLEEVVHWWRARRHDRMGPDRSSEFAVFHAKVAIPFAIARDLGRQRMMTQIWSLPHPYGGYGRDPLLNVDHPAIVRVREEREMILREAHDRLLGWTHFVPVQALQYACPLATMVTGSWVLNLRQLVYMLGLRTVPQGHPSYRDFMQKFANLVSHEAPIIEALVDDVTNYDDVVVGRPG